MGQRSVPGLGASAGRVLAAIGDRKSPERSLVRLGALAACLVWFCYAMLHGPGRPGLGSRPADLAVTVAVFAGVLALVAGVVVYRRGRSYGHLCYLASAVAGVVLYLLAPDRPASALL